ncbi:LOC688390 [Phodopus roborovskii]|uniref:LOC688390 protein n=1 Tax=Phodopus roborovskii TaxID=109678 RepID=A0AAU9YUC2_PHORO|nr:LOC688390 [Phodopus roborovskii]
MLRGSGGCWRPPVPGRRAPALLRPPPPCDDPCAGATGRPPHTHTHLLLNSETWAPVGSELASESDLEAAKAKCVGVKGGERALGPGVAAPGSGVKQTGPTAQARVSCFGGHSRLRGGWMSLTGVPITARPRTVCQEASAFLRTT